MYYRNLLFSLLALGLAASASAGNEQHNSLSIVVVDDATQDEVRVDLDDDTLGFDLADMQVGENRAVVDKNGQNVLITREENGYKFDVEGKTIRTPLRHGPGEFDVVVMGSPHAGHDGPMHQAPLPPLPPLAPMGTGTTIISSEPIDEETQQAIEALLEAAGHDGDIQFVDRRARGDALHDFHVIERRAVVRDRPRPEVPDGADR